ncbi:MAG: type VI secretion system ATPase TssH [Acidobacteriota bacterium]|jgi:type VI secretion system protein VasG|nr:type VI secretion system ATPase TssH [Bryobacteraceae bacterium CoA2 C42]
MSVNLKSLIGKLNQTTRAALEGAAGLALSRTHYDIEIEHFLRKLLDATDSDAAHILRHFGVDASRLTQELDRSLDRLKTGNARTPAIAPSLLKMFTEAWTIGSIEFGDGQIRTGLSLLALLTHEELARMLREVSKELQKVNAEGLKKEFAAIVDASNESVAPLAAAGPAGGGAAGAAKAGSGKQPNLDAYTENLTEKARKGKIDPVLGRDGEIRQVIDILLRRRQNNPILTGEPGVGKTAVVEGFALRIVQGDVPAPLKNVELHSLDLALLQAGAGIKGEFENRLKGLIEEIKSSPKPIILFIDEAHTMIGAGGQAGQGDAANLLKPALARGEMRTVAATTWSEYKKYFEKDPALARRFQVVKVEEPTEAVCMVMMRGIVSMLEKHHQVRILDEGLEAAVRLSHRYVAGRQLPDKAVSVLDTACAKLALGQNSTPAAIEDLNRRIDDLEVQQRVLTREQAVGTDHSKRLAAIDDELATSRTDVEALKKRFDKESGLVAKLRELRGRIEEKAHESNAAVELGPMREELAQLDDELKQLQGETPLMGVCLDGQAVSQIISSWTGIPVGKMLKDEIENTLNLTAQLTQRVIGQDHALDTIAQRIKVSKAKMEDPNKPIGVFMLVGPSGVGKTETALTLADLLYGGERNMITINMSEFQEAHTVSTLKGSPPGYVGYGEGGVLTEAVRRRPYSVVLLDEVEKAHPDVLELFFQVFDKGQMEDGEGREIDFKNTIIILTTNAATDQIMKLTADPETAPSPAGIVKTIKPELDKVFKPAFLGRMVIIPYYPVRDAALKQIIRLKLGKIQRRLKENHAMVLRYDDKVLDAVAARCTEVESGARNVDNILTNSLLPDISNQILAMMAAGEHKEAIDVTIGDDGAFLYS